MARYKQPSKWNGISVFLLLALLAAVYGGIKFGPAYYRKFKVSEVLDVLANRCRGTRQPDAETLDGLKREAEKQITALGVEDGRVRVDVHIDNQSVTVEASYKEVVRHWLISRTTTLNFLPRVERTRIRGF